MMTDLEPSIITELPTVPKDKIEDTNIDDQLPEVPSTVRIKFGSQYYIVLFLMGRHYNFISALQEPKSKSKTKTPVAELAS